MDEMTNTEIINETKKAHQIIVCFKITDDYDEILPKEWKALASGMRPETGYVRRIFGCFDEAALENGLLLKQMLQRERQDIQLTALTLNPGYSENLIKKITAVGYDRVVCLESGSNYDFAPQKTARILSGFIKQEEDVSYIITGKQCAPGSSGMVPFYLSEYLKRPLIRDVVEFVNTGRRICAVAEYPDRFSWKALASCEIFSMGNSRKSFLRIPTLREKMKYRSFEPECRQADLFHDDTGMRFFAVNQERNVQFTDEARFAELCTDLVGQEKQDESFTDTGF